MNIKNNKGVTITILVITIIVMLILFSITFSTATDLLKNSQRNKMKTMLYMVQSRAQILLDDYIFDNDTGDSASSDKLKAVTEDEIQNALKGTYIKNIADLKGVGYETSGDTLPEKDKVIYCSWNEDVLKSQGIDTKNLAQGDTIIIQYNIEKDEVDVASQKGFSDEGVAIHSLKDF